MIESNCAHGQAVGIKNLNKSYEMPGMRVNGRSIEFDSSFAMIVRNCYRKRDKTRTYASFERQLSKIFR
jgi:hypothetical protein